jgi:hypothetical protein
MKRDGRLEPLLVESEAFGSEGESSVLNDESKEACSWKDGVLSSG